MRTLPPRPIHQLAIAVIAAPLLCSSCSLDPSESEFQEAKVLKANGATTDAVIVHLEKAIANNPRRIQLYDERARIDMESNRFHDVIGDTSRAIQVDPKYAFGYYMRGLAQAQMQEYSKALTDFNEAISLKPGKSEYLNARSLCATQLGRYDMALKDADEAIKAEPSNGRWYYARGLACMKMQRFKEARESLDRCIQLSPDLVYPYQARAELHKLQGHTESGQQDSDKAKQMQATSSAKTRDEYYFQ
jgi:tetratricopeptide (TPR) repeat protein